MRLFDEQVYLNVPFDMGGKGDLWYICMCICGKSQVCMTRILKWTLGPQIHNHLSFSVQPRDHITTIQHTYISVSEEFLPKNDFKHVCTSILHTVIENNTKYRFVRSYVQQSCVGIGRGSVRPKETARLCLGAPSVHLAPKLRLQIERDIIW